MITAVATCLLTSRAGLNLGSIEVEKIEDGLVLGEFTPGPDYPVVKPHFLYFEELVEGQVLSLTDQAMEVIDGLGIIMSLPNGHHPVRDIQIYSDGGFSCRLPVAALNGKHSG